MTLCVTGPDSKRLVVAPPCRSWLTLRLALFKGKLPWPHSHWTHACQGLLVGQLSSQTQEQLVNRPTFIPESEASHLPCPTGMTSAPPGRPMDASAFICLLPGPWGAAVSPSLQLRPIGALPTVPETKVSSGQAERLQPSRGLIITTSALNKREHSWSLGLILMASKQKLRLRWHVP